MGKLDRPRFSVFDLFDPKLEVGEAVFWKADNAENGLTFSGTIKSIDNKAHTAVIAVDFISEGQLLLQDREKTVRVPSLKKGRPLASFQAK